MKVKRFISIFVVVALLASVVVFPASAAGFDSDLQEGKLMNLLDYGNSFESENNSQSFKGSVSFNYGLPHVNMVSYVDVIIRYWSSGGNDLESVKLLRHEAYEKDLTLLKVSNNTYRAFGVVSRSFGNIGVQLISEDASITSYSSISSFNIGLFDRTEANLSGSATVYTADETIQVTHKPSSLGTAFWEINDNMNDAYFLTDLQTSLDNCQKFDFIDYVFSLNVSSIDSISVMTDDRVVPFEVSYVDNSNSEASLYTIIVRVDLTDFNRSSASAPVVTVRGVSHWVNTNSLVVHDIVGHVLYTYENPVIYWFKKTFSAIGDGFSTLGSKLTSGFNSVVNAITGNSAAADQAGDDMDDAAGDLDDIGGAFDNIDTPDIDASSLTADYTSYSPSGLAVLSAITGNSYVTALLALVFTFALCAYIFFGRKR